MLNVYLSARWGRRDEMRHAAAVLRELGHHVTSSWLTEPDGMEPGIASQIDIDDIIESNCFIAFTEEPSVGYTTGGRWVELGYAIANELPICVVGPRENVFCHLPEVMVAPTLLGAVTLLTELFTQKAADYEADPTN